MAKRASETPQLIENSPESVQTGGEKVNIANTTETVGYIDTYEIEPSRRQLA